MAAHIVDVLNVGQQHGLPNDLLKPNQMGQVAAIIAARFIDYDEVWPDGEIMIDTLVPSGKFVFAQRADLTFSGGREDSRVKEPAARATIYAFHSIPEAEITAAIAIVRMRDNEQAAQARRDNPNWPLSNIMTT